MDKLIESITKLESNGNVDKEMYPFIVLKKYLTDTISYNVAMKELQFYSGAYKNLVQSIMNKHKNIIGSGLNGI